MIQSLRAGDEAGFATVVSRYHGSLVRTAQKYVRNHAAAEEVVQETWLGFMSSLDRFEGRCSIKTWLFRILMNKAKTRGSRDQRSVPFSTLASQESREEWSPVDRACFASGDGATKAGHWKTPPTDWGQTPESMLLDAETMEIVRAAMDSLPAAQGMVMQLRDVGGLSADEVCATLGVTAGNQRVLLHRARARVRAALSTHLA